MIVTAKEFWLIMLGMVVVVPISAVLAWCFFQFLIWLVADESHLRVMAFTWLVGAATGFMIGCRMR